MLPLIREIIDNSKFSHIAVTEIARLLPDEDSDLDRWLGEAIHSHDENGFIFLIAAAIHQGKRVDSKHLGAGISMLPHLHALANVAWNVEGTDIPEQLLVGTRRTIVGHEIHAAALFVAGEWCAEHREGVLPPDLLTEARVLARVKNLKPHAKAMLISLARRYDDTRILKNLFHGLPEDSPKWQAAIKAGEAIGRELMEQARGPIFNLIPATPSTEITGITVRRSVDHIGRNDPCPCGSGSKYKRCCFGKDQQRLKMSTDVPGKIYAEVMAAPEEHMSSERLEKLRGHELARIDPTKLDADLLQQFFERLCLFLLLDDAVDKLETMDAFEEFEAVWNFSMWTASRLDRKDIAERLMRLRANEPPALEEVEACGQFLLARDDPAAFLRSLEALALKVIETDNGDELVGMACGLLGTVMKGTAILISRAAIPLVSKKSAVFLLDQILETREKLNLSPDEPFSDILDQRFSDDGAAKGARETEKLREARQKLQAKAGEVNRMKNDMEKLHAEIQRREQKAAENAAKPTPAPAAPVDLEVLRDLREKVSTLKSELKERHEERAVLRRELNTTLNEVETLRESQNHAHGSPADHEDNDDHLVLPTAIGGSQPVRLIEFPKKFHHTLGRFPKQIARGTMTLLGRLAAGEPDAFQGVVRLKQRPNTLRARIGIDHRLLFRLETETIHVVDLIPRQDLERRIKSL